MPKNNLKKIDLIKNLVENIGFSEIYSKKIVDDLFEIITLNIKTGKFVFKNVGSFKLIQKKERIGRNPKTKKEFVISKRKSISFKPSKKILNKLNKF